MSSASRRSFAPVGPPCWPTRGAASTPRPPTMWSPTRSWCAGAGWTRCRPTRFPGCSGSRAAASRTGCAATLAATGQAHKKITGDAGAVEVVVTQAGDVLVASVDSARVTGRTGLQPMASENPIREAFRDRNRRDAAATFREAVDAGAVTDRGRATFDGRPATAPAQARNGEVDWCIRSMHTPYVCRSAADFSPSWPARRCTAINSARSSRPRPARPGR